MNSRIAARAKLKEKREAERQAVPGLRVEPVCHSDDETECIPDENNEPLENECDGIEELEMSM